MSDQNKNTILKVMVLVLGTLFTLIVVKCTYDVSIDTTTYIHPYMDKDECTGCHSQRQYEPLKYNKNNRLL